MIQGHTLLPVCGSAVYNPRLPVKPVSFCKEGKRPWSNIYDVLLSVHVPLQEFIHTAARETGRGAEPYTLYERNN